MSSEHEAVLPYVYRWDRHGRKGQPCEVTARGTKNSICVRFADGYSMVTSGNSIRRSRPLPHDKEAEGR